MLVRAVWKNQIGPWVEAGYRVVAPDMLGYGQTDKPDEPKEYSPKKLSDDLAALLDHIGSPKAVRRIIRSLTEIVDARFPARFSPGMTGVRSLLLVSFSGTLSGC